VGGVCLGQTIRLTSAVGYCPVGFKPGSNRLGSNNCSRVISQILGFSLIDFSNSRNVKKQRCFNFSVAAVKTTTLSHE